MAKSSIESVRMRPNTSEENRTILREIETRNEVDARRQDELNILFDRLNAECASRSLEEKRMHLDSPEKLKNVKTVHYGPLPGFRSGAWWGIRMDCSRDCIHEPFNEDLDEGPFGAVSICTSNSNTQNDIDLGDVLTFTSHEYCSTKKSKDSLVLSYKNRIPIRVVRSYSLSNKYAPKTGYRYDGLYTVLDYWIGVSLDGRKYHKFVLSRVLDQELSPWAEKMSNSSKVSKLKKNVSPRVTRSHANVKSQEPKSKNYMYNKVQKESKVENVSAIVSRQVFKKFIPESPDSSPRSVSSSDSMSSCFNSSPAKLYNTNLSIRTNLYDSSHQLHDVKKAASITLSKIFKSHPYTPLFQKYSQDEVEKINVISSDLEDSEKIVSICKSTTNESMEKKVKKVTWADSCNSVMNSIEKSFSTTGNGFQYSGSGVVDGFSPTVPSKCSIVKYNNVASCSSTDINLKSNNLLISSTKNAQNLQQTALPNLQNICESFHETEALDEPSSSIDSVTPDALVNVIVKEKYHPMAKILIGNMIGLENEESSILSAYNTLASKVDQDDSKISKENKLRNKFYIRNKTRKNGVLKKQRREITNLIIDAKFDPVIRGSRNRRLRSPKKRLSKSEISQRKIINARRIQSRNINKEIRNVSRDQESMKSDTRIVEEITITKRPQMVSVWTQCTLLEAPTVDQAVQTGESQTENVLSETDIKVELVDLEDIKLETCDVESNNEEELSEVTTTDKSYFKSAFAPVNTVDSSLRISRLRSIGFKPIETCSPMEDEDSNQESVRPEFDEEYNKYTSEENDIVGYMDEQLHYEDIEDEEIDSTVDKQSQNNFIPQSMETLTEEDFNKPWHGWRKVCVDGQVYWTGY